MQQVLVAVHLMLLQLRIKIHDITTSTFTFCICRARSSIEHEAMRGRAWRKRRATERSSTYRRWGRIVSSPSLGGSGMLLLVRLSSALLAWLCAERGRNRERSRERIRGAGKGRHVGEEQGLGTAREEQNLVATEYGRSRERAQN
jgi:hypothetical protein